MRRAFFICLCLCLTAASLSAQSMLVSTASQTARMFPPNDLGDRSAILDAYGKLPVTFEANQGQADETVKFLSRNAGYALFLTVDEAVVAVPGRNKLTVERAWLPQVLQSETAIPSVLRMKLHNANPGV